MHLKTTLCEGKYLQATIKFKILTLSLNPYNSSCWLSVAEELTSLTKSTISEIWIWCASSTFPPSRANERSWTQIHLKKDLLSHWRISQNYNPGQMFLGYLWKYTKKRSVVGTSCVKKMGCYICLLLQIKVSSTFFSWLEFNLLQSKWHFEIERHIYRQVVVMALWIAPADI